MAISFSVCNLFSDHMVLCHDRENPVWGTARPGAEVCVRFAGRKFSCSAGADGHWMTMVDTPEAGTICEMAIECQDERIFLRDIACGEVWLAGGQSNMEMPVMLITGGRDLVESCPDVRLKSVARLCRNHQDYGWHFYPTNGTSCGWMLPNRRNIALFSAIGFTFGKLLSEALHMPVGIIDCNWGGTKIQSWMPRAELERCEDTAADIAAYAQKRAALGKQAEEPYIRYEDSVRPTFPGLDAYIQRNLDDPSFFLKNEPPIAFLPEGAPGDQNEPGCLYKYMIELVAPYGIRGVLWYQGESNAAPGEAERYQGLFERMAHCWREAWQDARLPFLTCQLATFDPAIWNDPADWVTLRAQQSLCAKAPGISMAVLTDVGEARNIHPFNKIPVARRLADLALEDVYSLFRDAQPPRAESCVRTPRGIVVTFQKPVVIAGTSSDILLDTGEVCGATSCGDRAILLSARTAANAKQVRCGQSNYFVPSMFGTNGQPVEPFILEIAE